MCDQWIYIHLTCAHEFKSALPLVDRQWIDRRVPASVDGKLTTKDSLDYFVWISYVVVCNTAVYNFTVLLAGCYRLNVCDLVSGKFNCDITPSPPVSSLIAATASVFIRLRQLLRQDVLQVQVYRLQHLLR